MAKSSIHEVLYLPLPPLIEGNYQPLVTIIHSFFRGSHRTHQNLSEPLKKKHGPLKAGFWVLSFFHRTILVGGFNPSEKY